jgi:hypothetical protein
MEILNSIVSLIHYNRLYKIDYFRKNASEVQYNSLKHLTNIAANTEFGKRYNFASIISYEDFSSKVPVHEYDDFKPYIEKVMNGEQNIIWPTEIKWFAKSSGTTSDKSKFIPISRESLEECHFQSGKDIYAMYAHSRPASKIFVGKTLVIGGSTNINMNSENSYYGDLSAILIKNLPFWTYFSRIPNEEISLIEEWEIKLQRILDTSLHKDVTNIVGVPSWFLVLFKRILDETGANNIHEIWPNLELFIHGGISFGPYKSVYNKLFPKSQMTYLETYNASEGFFGIQDEFDKKVEDLLLMLDYGIFYEFIALKDYSRGIMNAVPLEGVKTGVNYAMIISTNGGLWRYMIGDTVSFTSTNPYKIKITGRTKHFINAFGEEVIIENAQRALRAACEETGAEIKDYTAAPVYMNREEKGSHEWLFEFLTEPSDINVFMKVLDETLKQANSDYEAKRYQNLTLDFPKHVVLKNGTFYKWLESRGKLGGQNKVPRLANSRQYVDELLKINEQN